MLTNQLIDLYNKLNPEGHFFSKESMRFWGSSVSTILKPTEDGSVFFLTREDNFDRTKKIYTLRFMPNKERAGIETLEFQKFEDRKDAVEALKELKRDYEVENKA